MHLVINIPDKKKVTIRKWGNSLGIRIPASVVRSLSLENGDSFEFEYEVREDKIIFN